MSCLCRCGSILAVGAKGGVTRGWGIFCASALKCECVCVYLCLDAGRQTAGQTGLEE